jgi:hypothetical protein
MNALTRTYSGVAAVLTGSEKSPREGQRRLYAAIALYGFSDSVSVDHAFEAYFEDKPAYWTTADYHSQRAIGLMDALNRGCEFGIALAANYPAHCTKYRPAALDTLVPLNIKAANELVKAYDALGIWRDVEELEARRERDMRRAA